MVDWIVRRRVGRVYMEDFSALPSGVVGDVLERMHFTGSCNFLDSSQKVAYSDFFEPLNDGQCPPLYRLHVSPDGSYEFVRDVG